LEKLATSRSFVHFVPTKNVLKKHDPSHFAHALMIVNDTYRWVHQVAQVGPQQAAHRSEGQTKVCPRTSNNKFPAKIKLCGSKSYSAGGAKGCQAARVVGVSLGKNQMIILESIESIEN
jgi:hypothetical protein